MIRAMYTVECDDCNNVPGWYCEFPTKSQAMTDAEEKGWYIGILERAFCPDCRRSRNIP